MSKNEDIILNKLKKLSKLNKIEYQLLLQLFCQEEFMRRIQKSKYHDKFILKGGLLIYALTNFESRLTTDIDFLVKNTSNSLLNIETILNEIINKNENNDFIIFEILKISPIGLLKEYTGVKIMMLVKIKNTKTYISIDIGFGDVVSPTTLKLIYPTIIDEFDKPLIYCYSIESIISEKLDAILNLKNISSRMKDYYDIYYLSKSFDFNLIELTNAFCKTFTNRRRNYIIDDFKEVINLKNDLYMNQKWDNFILKSNISKISFEEIINSIELFLFSPFINIEMQTIENKVWNKDKFNWE